MDRFKLECKLCETIIKDENFKIIDDSTKSILRVLLLKLTLDNETQNVMCMTCSLKLHSALNFKSSCLCTDNSVILCIDVENPTPVDLKEVNAKEKGQEERGKTVDSGQICRLCLHRIISDFKLIQEVPSETIRIYIPEINFAATTNPVFCVKCHDALCVHSSFLKNCLEVEKMRNMLAMDVGDSCIKREEIEIKLEQIDDATSSEILCNLENREWEEWDTSSHSQNGLVDIEESKSLYDPDDLKPISAESTSPNYESKECINKTISESLWASHEPQHKKDSEIQANDGRNRKINRQRISKNQLKPVTEQEYQCDKCIFKTRHKKSLKAHQLLHKDPSELQIFQCADCDYKSVRKSYLRLHQLKHKEVQIYNCDECNYKSTAKSKLKQHRLIHKDRSEVEMYQCNECDYKSIRKGDVKVHEVRHRGQVYECGQCSYKTKRKSDLWRHQLIHNDPSEVRIYECAKCKFLTKHRSGFKQHQLTHKNPSEVQMYDCGECSYKSKRKGDLKKHQLTHKHLSEAQACRECDYKSVKEGDLFGHQLKDEDPSEMRCKFDAMHRGSFYDHQLLHKDPPDIQTYECSVCSYKTKRKGDLKKHQSKHRDLSEAQVCDECGYRSVKEGDFRRHKLVHKFPAGVQIYECGECKFITKHKSSLVHHQLTHTDPSGIEMHECGQCSYKTKRKGDLKSHQLRHTSASEVRMYECSQCSNFKTKRISHLKKHRLIHCNHPL